MSRNGFVPWNYFDYFVWLCNKVDTFTAEHSDYVRVLRDLHDTEFIWGNVGNLAHDENRAIAGRQLRYEFMSGKAVPTNVYGGMESPASVLEVLVALAVDINNKIVGSDTEPGRWFWLMLRNLGVLDSRENLDSVRTKIDRWLHRDFEFDGVGSPFPLGDCDTDQRKVELWLQACGYFSEPYMV